MKTEILLNLKIASYVFFAAAKSNWWSWEEEYKLNMEHQSLQLAPAFTELPILNLLAVLGLAPHSVAQF
jgi:hypothetical protein